MARGGLRSNPGGRPKGTTGIKHQSTLTKEAAREGLRLVVEKHAEALHMAQIANAQGIKYLVGREKKTGKFTRLKQEEVEAVLSGEDDTYAYLEVWEKDPSVQAYTDLMNRYLDKPKEQEQTLVITGELALVTEKLLRGRKRAAPKG